MKYGEDPIHSLNDEKLEKFLGLLADAEPSGECLKRLAVSGARELHSGNSALTVRNLWMGMALLAACALAGVLYFTFWDKTTDVTPQTSRREAREGRNENESPEKVAGELLDRLNLALSNRDSQALVDVIAPSFWEECVFTLTRYPAEYYSVQGAPIRNAGDFFARLDYLFDDETIGSAFAAVPVELASIQPTSRWRAVLTCSFSTVETGRKFPVIFYAVRENGQWFLTGGMTTISLLLAVQDKIHADTMSGQTVPVVDQNVESPK